MISLSNYSIMVKLSSQKVSTKRVEATIVIAWSNNNVSKLAANLPIRTMGCANFRREASPPILTMVIMQMVAVFQMRRRSLKGLLHCYLLMVTTLAYTRMIRTILTNNLLINNTTTLVHLKFSIQHMLHHTAINNLYSAKYCEVVAV